MRQLSLILKLAFSSSFLFPSYIYAQKSIRSKTLFASKLFITNTKSNNLELQLYRRSPSDPVFLDCFKIYSTNVKIDPKTGNPIIQAHSVGIFNIINNGQCFQNENKTESFLVITKNLSTSFLSYSLNNPKQISYEYVDKYTWIVPSLDLRFQNLMISVNDSGF